PAPRPRPETRLATAALAVRPQLGSPLQPPAAVPVRLPGGTRPDPRPGLAGIAGPGPAFHGKPGSGGPAVPGDPALPRTVPRGHPPVGLSRRAATARGEYDPGTSRNLDRRHRQITDRAAHYIAAAA